MLYKKEGPFKVQKRRSEMADDVSKKPNEKNYTHNHQNKTPKIKTPIQKRKKKLERKNQGHHKKSTS